MTSRGTSTALEAAQLSRAARGDLVAGMRVSLSAALPLPGEQPYPPGAVDYYATYNVAWFPGDNEEWQPGDEAIVAHLAEAAKVATDQEHVLIPAGRAHMVVVDTGENVFEALDAREADLAYLAELLFTDSEIHPDLEDQLAGFEQHAVLVNNVAVEPAWRGLSLGLLGTGIALTELSRGCRFAALDAIQPGLDDDQERQRSHRRLATYWAKLGFQAWQDRVLVLDLATTALAEALASINPTRGS